METGREVVRFEVVRVIALKKETKPITYIVSCTAYNLDCVDCAACRMPLVGIAFIISILYKYRLILEKAEGGATA